MNIKIGTHNSATGLHTPWYLTPLIPFARCQSRSLVEQWQAGARYFDIRLKLCCGKVVFAHGLWHSDVDVMDALTELDTLAMDAPEPTWISVTYEGSLNDTEAYEFRMTVVWSILTRLRNLHLDYVAQKRPWRILYHDGKHSTLIHQAFTVLDGRSWHTLLPIPRLWAELYPPTLQRGEVYNLVDFL